MELIWIYKDKDNAHRYHEAHIDFDMESSGGQNGSVFYENPFALGMQAIAGTQSTDGMIFPVAPKGSSDGDYTSLRIGERGIINPLWQYNDNADPRTAGAAGYNFGRVYNKTIRPNNPIVFVQPGRPMFIGADKFFCDGIVTNNDADGLRAAIADKMMNHTSSSFDVGQLLEMLSSDEFNKDNPSRFYDFEPDFSTFRTYAKAIMNELMVRMHIESVYEQDWGEGPGNKNDVFNQFMDYYSLKDRVAADAAGDVKWKQIQSSFLPFRVEKSTEASDSFSNSTGQSSIASSLRQQTDQAKEVQFMLDGGVNGGNQGPMAGMVKGAANAVTNVLGSATDQFEAVLQTGGNMIFPEIWKDSNYSRSISINIKLHAPNGNTACIYENILFPIVCWLCLAMPRQQGNSVYTSPPLVRMFSKGWFSCDMGMIESLTIRRGSDKNDWTIERLPRTVEISVSVKDLFGSMMMSLGNSSNSKISVFHKRNTMLRDYLNIIGGIDTFADTKLSNRFKMKWESIKNAWAQAWDPKNIVQNLLSNTIIGAPIRFAATWFS